VSDDASGFEAPEATEQLDSSDESFAASGTQAMSSRKEKVKIDGEELEVDLEDIKKDYQKFRSSEKRFQEAAALRKEAQEERELINDLLGRASKGDLGWLKGLVPKDVITQWAESELLEHIEWEKKPEAERRAILAEQKARELEEKVQKYTQTEEREQATRLEEQAYQQVEADIVQAVKDLGYNYKVQPRFIRRIAEQMYASLEASQDPQSAPLDARTASDRAFKGLLVDAQEILSCLPVAEALKLIPQSLRDSIRKADVEEAMNQMPNRMRKDHSPQGTSSKQQKFKRMSTDDYFSKLDNQFNK
jgi:hypothetical protein